MDYSVLGYKGWKKIRYFWTVKNLGNFGTAKRTEEGNMILAL